MTAESPFHPLNLDLDPLEAVSRWGADRPLVILHSGRVHPRWARWSILAQPCGWLVHDRGKTRMDNIPGFRVTNDPLEDLQRAFDTLRFPEVPASDLLPFAGGWIGWLSYELGAAIEPSAVHRQRRPGRHYNWPLYELAWCPDAIVFDHLEGRWWAVGDTDTLVARLRRGPVVAAAPFRHGGISYSLDDTRHALAIQRAIEYILAGDIFQANIATRLECEFEGSVRGLFLAAMNVARPWYGALIESPGGRCIVSMSPEMFLDLDPLSGRVTTRPIKGTASAQRPREELAQSQKDAAELHMIVDLMRNDLGRVCEFGSVRVVDPRDIETHPTIHHGVAEVTGVLRTGFAAIDLLRVTFPGGSVTGAPKIRAMQVIDEIEPVSRGPYCGAIGFVDRRGAMGLSIAIRTIALQGDPAPGRCDLLAKGLLTYGAGGGIVADSSPVDELRECRDKSAVLHAVLSRGLGRSPAEQRSEVSAAPR